MLVYAGGVLSPLVLAASIAVGLLTLVGFGLAARAYNKAKTVDTLASINEILRTEVEALTVSRDRMSGELVAAQAKILAQGEEIARLAAATDLHAHQAHLDVNHAETMGVLTRIADESARRNGDLSALMVTVLAEVREKL